MFARGLPSGTDLASALEGCGRFLKGNDPPPEEWRLEQVREAMRVFRKGIENWSVMAGRAIGARSPLDAL